MASPPSNELKSAGGFYADTDLTTDLNVESLEDLDKQMKDINRTIKISYKYDLTNRFQLLPEDQKRSTFIYHVRQSLSELLQSTLDLLRGGLTKDRNRPRVIRYIGNIGAGKSHNLAALAAYLRLRQQKGWLFDNKVVVYASDLQLFFRNDVRSLQRALISAYPDKAVELERLKTWDDLEGFVSSQPENSILFIFDDWNQVCPAPNSSDAEEALKLQRHGKLLKLSEKHYRIEALSAGCSVLTTGSSSKNRPHDTTILELFGGLSVAEWKIWRSRSELFRRLKAKESEEDGENRDGKEGGEVEEGKEGGEEEDDGNDGKRYLEDLSDFTGRVPLYLSELEKIAEDIEIEEDLSASEIMEQFEFGETGSEIKQDLMNSTEAFSKVKKDTFVKQMMHAISEGTSKTSIISDAYDHRYFYKKDKFHLRPVSGYVRNFMMELLQGEKMRDEAKAYLTSKWVKDALMSSNPSVRGFGFEHYALHKIAKYPSSHIKGVDGDISCTLKYFEGDSPHVEDLSAEGLTMFVPSRFNYDYVDAVVRYVRKGKSTVIYAVQVTLREIMQHKSTIDFFRKKSEPSAPVGSLQASSNQQLASSNDEPVRKKAKVRATKSKVSYRNFKFAGETTELELIWVILEEEGGRVQSSITPDRTNDHEDFLQQVKPINIPRQVTE